jgi:hypothetical protein
MSGWRVRSLIASRPFHIPLHPIDVVDVSVADYAGMRMLSFQFDAAWNLAVWAHESPSNRHCASGVVSGMAAFRLLETIF